MATSPEQETYDGGRPYEPPDVFKPHPDEPGGFNQWREITDLFGDAAPAAEGGEDASDTESHAEAGASSTPRSQVPRVFQAKFKSSSRQAEIFIHDPISALAGSDWSIHSDVPPDLLAEGMLISTHVINHHRTLAKKIIRAVALIDDESVGITVHKEDAS